MGLDAAPESRVTTQATLVVPSTAANLTMQPRYPAIGDEITVSMTDRDLDTSPNLPDIALVTVSVQREESPSGRARFDEMHLRLVETGASTGSFTGRIKLERESARPAGSGRIKHG